MKIWMNRIAQLAMRFILRSRLHGLVSKHIMLIGFRGRSSGKEYLIPVGYARQNGQIITSTLRSNRWWKNLQEGGPVTLWLAGDPVQGRGNVIDSDLDLIALTLQEFYQLTSLRPLSEKAAREVAAQRVLIRIRLESET